MLWTREPPGECKPVVKRGVAGNGVSKPKTGRPGGHAAHLIERALGHTRGVVIHAEDKVCDGINVALGEPFEHARVLLGLVEAFVDTSEIRGIDGLHADEDPAAAGGGDQVHWIAQISANLCPRDEELLDLIAASGGRWIFIGMESIDPANLAGVNKGFNKPEEYAGVLERLAQRDIYAITSFIFGMDNDTPGVAERTLDQVRSWPPGPPRFRLADAVACDPSLRQACTRRAAHASTTLAGLYSI